MIRIIKCETCEETMAILEKEVITEQDIEMYKLTVDCSLNHKATILEEPTE